MAGKDEKDFLIDEVSKRTNIRRDVVKDILESLTDVMISEIVNTGDFRLWKVFGVGSTRVSASKAPLGNVPEHVRLTSSLSYTIRRLWKIRFSRFGGSANAITADNWADVLRQDRLEERSRPSSISPSLSEGDVPQPDDYNPLLDDDDDEE